ncbi:MAG: TolB family protein [Planctomycetota bacterium]
MKIRQSWQVLGMAVVLGSTGWAQLTRRMSVASNGTEGNGDSKYPSISADGSSVAFYSLASNLVPGDTNGVSDILFRDRVSGLTENASVDSNEAPSNGGADTLPPSVSADGNLVAFASIATNLVPGDTNGTWDVFVRNRLSGTIQRVSVSSAGVQGNAQSFYASISADGRYVAFGSDATNLVPGDTNGAMDIFVRDLVNAVTERVSLVGIANEADGLSIEPSISADGRYVAFTSFATNLEHPINAFADVFRRDRQAQTTFRISRTPGPGTAPNGHSTLPSISADGIDVAFVSRASNIVSGDTNADWDVFCYDGSTGNLEIVSVSSTGTLADASSDRPSISADGSYVAFASEATNLVSGDTNGVSDVFVRSRSSGTTVRASITSGGAQADGSSEWPSISADGRLVAFSSSATNLVPGDTNGLLDVYLFDRDTSGFTSLCLPGSGGVIACPCSNPPTVSGRGCNNSAGTGGALLTASGMAYLSTDSLVFTTFGEKPTALSIVLQGTTYLSSGVVYGQGVRCVGGTLKRLYTKTASLGSITAPDFGAGNPSVSARSAALGNTIQSGQSRWYHVYYRDGVILGGCPATSTFSTTQTGRVDWSM